jgi:hypothetical protein
MISKKLRSMRANFCAQCFRQLLNTIAAVIAALFGRHFDIDHDQLVAFAAAAYVPARLALQAEDFGRAGCRPE